MVVYRKIGSSDNAGQFPGKALDFILNNFD